MKYICEHTDTFGGEPNYSWVQREELTLSDNVSDLSLVRAAKSVLGLSGVRCQRSEAGESIELRPYGYCSIVFITPIY
jgi:hypothetical protein